MSLSKLIHTHTHIYIYTHTHTYTNIYIQIHTYVVGSKSFRPDIQKLSQMENAARDI